MHSISVTGARGLDYAFMSLREKRAIAQLQVTELSRTDGGTDSTSSCAADG